MSHSKKHDSGASEASESSAGPGGGRWSAKPEVAVVLELLRGADLESTSCKHRVTLATLTDWRDRFWQRRCYSERRQRAVAREDLAPGGGAPFSMGEVEAVSRTTSLSHNKRYGVARVVSVWGLARSSFYAARDRERHAWELHKRGPRKVHSDEELVAEIRQLLSQPVFTGEGYREI